MTDFDSVFEFDPANIKELAIPPLRPVRRKVRTARSPVSESGPDWTRPLSPYELHTGDRFHDHHGRLDQILDSELKRWGITDA